MLLRGIAFAEARRNSARRVFKNRDNKTQGNGCERDAASSDFSHDGSLARHVRTTMMTYQPAEESLSPAFLIPFESEAISLVATASKLATVEDVGPKRPEGPIRPSAASLKVSPTARATLQALRSSKSKLVTTPVSTRDAETITDVCSGEELPEVEIISLLEEQIPRYRLRADTLTQFQGYENADWFIPAPVLKSEDVDLKLSPDQIRETLNYFILCSNRVSQMTKTYNDIEAVTRLLEEKEKDLELTARIGKELLAHNQKLETTVNALETELKEANEKITQLNHEVLKKTELIQILTNDVDESSSEAGTPTGLRGINLELLQRKVTSLEDENKQLRSEFAKLMHDADNSEEQEARLVKDIAAQLANANMEVDGIAEELGRQKDENRLQHEQIISLTAKLAETELRLAQLMAEHDEVGATLVITRDNQNTLAAELAEFKERYAEVVNLLAETQEQLRKQRKRGMPTVRGGSLFPSMGAAPQPDSIASELESSFYSELSFDSGIGTTDRMPSYKKVFETVRSSSRIYAGMDPNQFPRISSMTTSTLSSNSVGPRMSCGQVRPQTSTFPSLDSGHSESEGTFLNESEDYPGPQRTGVPGAPGAADLEAALRRLTPTEVLARRACLSIGAGYSYDYDGGILHSPPTFLPFDCRTPDSIMSTGSSGNLSGFSGNSGNAWRIPQKLQIVKPMEGSQTLHHWSRLATPTLGGLLEDRPGVKTRGGRALEDLGLITFALSDLEEDEEYTNPGKPFQDTGSIYTFTNSTVMHPDDHTTNSVTPSIVSSRVATAPNSGMNSGMSTPRTHSRRNSTSTFSTTLGLAKMLNERGIKAVTPSCIGTPTDEQNFSPTATPCNSPDASLSPRSSSPPPESGASLTLGLLSTGAELLRRTFSYEPPPVSVQSKKKRPKSTISRSDKKALTGIRLVEKLERIGIDTIMATTVNSSISPLALQGALYTRRLTGSPMAQLTFLKTSMSSSTSQEKLISPSSSTSSTSDELLLSKSSSLPDKRNGSKERELNKFDSNAFSSKTAGQSPDRQRRSGAKATRPDLGRVKPPVSTPVTKESKQSALGAISSLLFGRKGGLL
ncbi:trafficking kinesin-binding protein milt isoform X1 [Pogonomyrmex barbatus]|uniref:Trafficking kinesin-binding protein milt isoform X1 n=2 Tax=Pogonomyrmex barbatus TaxID=144034 RepID=A0A6I9VR23_9HYME|nr:trafficking kinesin-binding protein milt isoform X1 [Pogonomyrmex barbatus]